MEIVINLVWSNFLQDQQATINDKNQGDKAFNRTNFAGLGY